MEPSTWTLGILHSLSSDQLEKLLADLWGKMGYEVVRNPIRGADGGIDVLAKTRTAPKLTVSIQAKAYHPQNKVGVREVREYASLRQRHGIDAVIVATTSSFTEQAMREAADFNVKLLDGDALIKLLNEHQITTPTTITRYGQGERETHASTPTSAGWRKDFRAASTGTLTSPADRAVASDLVRARHAASHPVGFPSKPPSHRRPANPPKDATQGGPSSFVVGGLVLMIIAALAGEWGVFWVLFVVGAVVVGALILLESLTRPRQG